MTAARATASRLVGLTVSSTTSRARSMPSQLTTRRGRRVTSMALHDARDATARHVPEPGHRRQRADLLASGLGDRPRDRDARSRPRRRRRAGAPRPALAPFEPRTSTSRSLPSVTVPVLSSTIVVARRVCSSTSGPRMKTPSWAPRPVPTSSAVGVARPSAHGQAMMSTATAAVKAAEGSPVTSSQPASVASESSDHDRDEHGRDPVDEPLHRRLAGLRLRRRAARSARALSPPRPAWPARRAGRGALIVAAGDLGSRARPRPATTRP